jgi:hypothetical protein
VLGHHIPEQRPATGALSKLYRWSSSKSSFSLPQPQCQVHPLFLALSSSMSSPCCREDNDSGAISPQLSWGDFTYKKNHPHCPIMFLFLFLSFLGVHWIGKAVTSPFTLMQCICRSLLSLRKIRALHSFGHGHRHISRSISQLSRCMLLPKSFKSFNSGQPPRRPEQACETHADVEHGFNLGCSQ